MIQRLGEVFREGFHQEHLHKVPVEHEHKRADLDHQEHHNQHHGYQEGVLTIAIDVLPSQQYHPIEQLALI